MSKSTARLILNTCLKSNASSKSKLIAIETLLKANAAQPKTEAEDYKYVLYEWRKWFNEEKSGYQPRMQLEKLTQRILDRWNT